MKMSQGAKCPNGTEITTKEECDDALKFAPQLGIDLRGRKHVVYGGWNFVPPQCSYLAKGDQAFHFNIRGSYHAGWFIQGVFTMICKHDQGQDGNYSFSRFFFKKVVCCNTNY